MGDRPSPSDQVDERRVSFDRDAASYDARPSYPPEVLDALRSTAGLAPGCRVLEVGPGTGQATLPLLDAGASVDAVELGPALAARLRERAAGRDLRVVVGAFEDVAVEREAYDLVVAATAFHWVPADAGLARAADALRPGGWLALWWTVFGDPGGPAPFADALRPGLERIAPTTLTQSSAGTAGGRTPHGLDTRRRIGEIDRAGRFGPVDVRRVRWTQRFAPADVRALYATFSPWRILADDVRAAGLDHVEAVARRDFGGVVDLTFVTALYLAERLPAANGREPR